MKKLFMLAMLVVLSISCVLAQKVLPDSVKIYPENTSGIISFVFRTKNTPDAAFNNAKQWVAKNYKAYKQVVQMEDATSHSLVFKGQQLIGRYKGSYGGYATEHSLAIEFIATVECKEGKFRIKIEDLTPKGTMYFSGMKETPLQLQFSDADSIEEEKSKPKVDPSYIAMLENIIPGTKETIAAIISSMAQNISYNDDF